jgi:predicted phage tail protein
MTNIILHGILADNFGKEINLEIGNIKTLLDAIDANKDGFIKKINSLSEMGLNYCIIVDGELMKERTQIDSLENPKQIDIVPIVCGHGFVLAAIGIAGLVAGSALSIGLLTTLGGIFLSTGLAMLLAPTPDYPDAVQAEQYSTGLEKSFAFANRANVAAQGVAVPVGYGRLKVGSQVIQACTKSYPQNTTAIDAMLANPANSFATYSSSDSEILKEDL